MKVAEMGLETSNTSKAFNSHSNLFEQVDFDDLLRSFQDWNDILKDVDIDFDEVSP